MEGGHLRRDRRPLEVPSRAGSEEAAIGVGIGLVAGFLGADIAFAANGLIAADKGVLARDGWITAQVIVTVPQTLLFNTLLLGMGTSESRTLRMASCVR